MWGVPMSSWPLSRAIDDIPWSFRVGGFSTEQMRAFVLSSSQVDWFSSSSSRSWFLLDSFFTLLVSHWRDPRGRWLAAEKYDTAVNRNGSLKAEFSKDVFPWRNTYPFGEGLLFSIPQSTPYPSIHPHVLSMPSRLNTSPPCDMSQNDRPSYENYWTEHKSRLGYLPSHPKGTAATWVPMGLRWHDQGRKRIRQVSNSDSTDRYWLHSGACEPAHGGEGRGYGTSASTGGQEVWRLSQVARLQGCCLHSVGWKRRERIPTTRSKLSPMSQGPFKIKRKLWSSVWASGQDVVGTVYLMLNTYLYPKVLVMSISDVFSIDQVCFVYLFHLWVQVCSWMLSWTQSQANGLNNLSFDVWHKAICIFFRMIPQAVPPSKILQTAW